MMSCFKSQLNSYKNSRIGGSIQVFVTKTKTLCEDLHHLVTLRKKLRRFGGDKMHETFAGLYDEQMLFYDEKHGFHEVKTLWTCYPEK